MSESFTSNSLGNFGFYFTAVIHNAFEDQEVAFKIQITNSLRFKYSAVYLQRFSY